jgi:hypothetical protein
VNPNARYITAGVGALANVGRNTEPGRPIDNIDLSLIKHFAFRERYRIDLEGQALNLFNHPQFIAGNVNDSASKNSFTSGSQNLVTAGNPVFNRPDLAFSSSPRIIQVVARINF